MNTGNPGRSWADSRTKLEDGNKITYWRVRRYRFESRVIEVPGTNLCVTAKTSESS